ncbi:MAG: hypothetical protein ACE5F8_04930, partial [Woeseiaceae bacterium]
MTATPRKTGIERARLALLGAAAVLLCAGQSLADDVPLADAVADAEGGPEPLRLLGAEVFPGQAERLNWAATELFEGVSVS